MLTSCGFELGNKNAYIVSSPNKTTYNVNEAFDSDGLILIDVDNGNQITNFTTSIANGYIFNKNDIGTKSVTVSASGYKNTYFNVFVVDLPALSLSGDYKTVFEYGDYFSLEGLIVTSGNEVITDYKCNFNVENKLTTPGQFKVIISKEGYYEASYYITVRTINELHLASLPTKTNYVTGDAFSLSGIDVRDQNNDLITDYVSSIDEGTILKYENEALEVTISKEGFKETSFNIKVDKNQEYPTKEKDITIYYLNDTHGSYARYQNTYKDEAGMSYISKYIKDKRKLNPNGTFLFSGGDMFEGGFESNSTQGQIMIEAMNSMEFDVMALGNHEFDWGEEVMEEMVTSLDCEVVSANTFYKDGYTRPSYLKPYTIIERDGLKIGVIGGIKEHIESSITGSVSAEFSFPDPVSYALTYASELRIQENCDLVFIVSHDGGNDGETYRNLTEIDSKSGRSYVDGIFLAHDHYRKKGTVNNVPYLESQCNGIIIGKMNFSLVGDGVSYEIESSSTEYVWAYENCLDTDPEIEAISSKYQDLIDEGKSVITTFSYALTDSEFLDIILQAMIWYVNSNPDIFFDSYVYFASHNIGGVRVSTIRAGDFTMHDLVKAYPFDNLLTIQTCKSTHISYMANSSYYQTMIYGQIKYDANNRTHAVSIDYISDNARYGKYCQESYQKSEITAKQALIYYLKSGESL